MIVKTYPKVGDARSVVKFAWFPVLIGNLDGGVKVWLESYIEHQVYGTRFIFETCRWYVTAREIKK